MARRWYELNYPDKSSVFLEDFGNVLKLSGVLFSGKGRNILLLTPQTEMVDADNLVIQKMLIDEFSEVIRMTDDPQYFELDESGNIKAVHRKVRMAVSGAVQQKIWKRDGLMCMYCGREMGDVQLTVDHFVPLEHGGANDQSNYLTACRGCNKKKGNMKPEDFCNDTMFGYDYYVKYLANQRRIT